MENIPNISWEEELVKLRDQGKVSEAEYEELLAAMQRTAGRERKSETPQQERSKRKLGRIAFALMLVGIVGPLLLYFVAHLLVPPEPNWQISIGTLLLPALAIEVAAFAMGIGAWPDVYAKVAVVVSGFCVVVFVLLTA